MTCNKSHHTLLACVSISTPSSQSQNTVNPVPSLNPNAADYQPAVRLTNQPTSTLKYSPSTHVELLSKDGSWHRAVALFDSGSDVTLIKSDLVKRLNLDRKPCVFKFGIAGGGYRTEDSANVSLWIRRCDKKSGQNNISAVELEKPAYQIPSVENDFFEKYPYLKTVQKWLPKESTDVDLLIGYDYADLMAPTGYLHHPTDPEKYPTAVETRLGWYMYGPSNSSIATCDEVVNVHRVKFQENVQNLQSLVDSDLCGVKPTRLCACSDKEIVQSQFLKHVKNTIKQTDEGRIEVSLPWKKGFPTCLEFNRSQAFAKLKSLERRLNNSNMMECYNHEMKTILDQYAEAVPLMDIHEKRGWYLDHFPVLRPGKSTACRIVWNSAAVYNGLSLNDGFFKGPDLLNNLFLVLLAWRLDEVVLFGDIRKMFNQIQIAPADRVYHRFLWRYGNPLEHPKDFQWKRLPFGDKPAPDLSISALRFLADKHSDIFPDASRVIKNHCYMDDIVTSTESQHDAMLLKEQLNVILSKGKFTVKGWHSNCSFVDEFPDETLTTVLGHDWDKHHDTLRPNFPDIDAHKPLTKREALSIVSKFWDPMGIFAPITLKLRLLLQALWQLKLSWDDPIPDAINVKFITFVQDICNLNQFRITRCLKPEFALDTVELHGFSDGGEQAYGAAVWLRWHTTIGVALTFVAAKAYVAPLKKRSIPRLELMGMVVLTRFVASIKSVINVTKVFLWTDSATVLHWLSLPASNFKPFVSTRIQEIKETLPENADCFRYVNSRSNLADALTKPIPASKLSLWHKNPRFLLNPCEKWPNFNTPLASHMNGAVESLIRSCRKAFNAASDYLRHSYTHFQWETIVAEANYLVNSRPLFPKSVEDLDEEPITGNSLLYPFDGQHVPQPECDIDVRMSVKFVQGFVKRFWESWIRNMPPQLLLRSKWFRARSNLQVGDYVIILDPGLIGRSEPRGLWEHAIEAKTFPGKDKILFVKSNYDSQASFI